MNGSPTEPSADIREAASAAWQIFVALMNEGFTERQALMIVAQIVSGGGSGNAP